MMLDAPTFTSAWLGPWDPTQPLPAAFTDLPRQVYASDANWLGEDPAAVQRQFSAANPWFADGQAWLGVIPGQARLAGFCRQQEIDGEVAAFFGYWEGVDELAPHQHLFASLQDWARQQGAKRLYGPINFSTYGAYRLRLDAHDEPAFPGEPANPSYYPTLLTQQGFALRYRYLSTFQDTPSVINTVKADYLRIKPKLEQNLRFDAMTPAFWMSHLDELYGFVEAVFGNNFAYTPISRAGFEAACGQDFAQRFCPQTSVLARRLDGRIAGFFLAFPDYSPLMRQGSVTPIPASTISYEQHARLLPRPRLGLAKTGGVHPDLRTSGLFTALSCELSLRADGVYGQLCGALVREDNPSLKFAQRHGQAHARHYGLYHLPL